MVHNGTKGGTWLRARSKLGSGRGRYCPGRVGSRSSANGRWPPLLESRTLVFFFFFPLAFVAGDEVGTLWAMQVPCRRGGTLAAEALRHCLAQVGAIAADGAREAQSQGVDWRANGDSGVGQARACTNCTRKRAQAARTPLLSIAAMAPGPATRAAIMHAAPGAGRDPQSGRRRRKNLVPVSR